MALYSSFCTGLIYPNILIPLLIFIREEEHYQPSLGGHFYYPVCYSFCALLAPEELKSAIPYVYHQISKFLMCIISLGTTAPVRPSLSCLKTASQQLFSTSTVYTTYLSATLDIGEAIFR